jgi:hypothetical protein
MEDTDRLDKFIVMLNSFIDDITDSQQAHKATLFIDIGRITKIKALK